MLTFTNAVHDNELLCLENYYPPEDTVIFDIETTGFAADTSVLYLIGCGYYDDGRWFIKQWFNDNINSEHDIIEQFFSFIRPYKYLLHYNGDGFDIPYLKKKIISYNMENVLHSLESIDLYKVIRPYKDILHTDNLKQKSIELLLGIKRLDKYSGGDLIRVYQNYTDSHNDTALKLLIQHNYEDIEGLMYSFCLMSYKSLTDGCLTVHKMYVRDNRLCFLLELTNALPKRISCGAVGVTFTGYGLNATLSADIIEDDLKFFFDNYRDYYYLPAEDTAIHKSVAGFVDKNYRVQATRSTCYTKHRGCYISQLDCNIVNGYKKCYDDSDSLIELTDSFLQDMDILNKYAVRMVQRLILK